MIKGDLSPFIQRRVQALFLKQYDERGGERLIRPQFKY